MNTRVSRIAKRQARLGGFVESTSPPPEASEDDDDDDEDGDSSSSAITRILCHFSVRFPLFDHFHIMGAIDAATIKRSKA